MRPFTARLIDPPVTLGRVDMIRREEEGGRGVGSEWKRGRVKAPQMSGNPTVGNVSKGGVINRAWWDTGAGQGREGQRESRSGLGPDLDRRGLEFGSDGRAGSGGKR
jgi:hypothetical protein